MSWFWNVEAPRTWKDFKEEIEEALEEFPVITILRYDMICDKSGWVKHSKLDLRLDTIEYAFGSMPRFASSLDTEVSSMAGCGKIRHGTAKLLLLISPAIAEHMDEIKKKLLSVDETKEEFLKHYVLSIAEENSMKFNGELMTSALLDEMQDELQKIC